MNVIDFAQGKLKKRHGKQKMASFSTEYSIQGNSLYQCAWNDLPLAPNSLLGKQILGCTGISDLSVAMSRGKSLSLELEVLSLSFGLLRGITDEELLVDSLGLGPTSLASDSELYSSESSPPIYSGKRCILLSG